jgi:hypothetical protein
MLTSSHHFWMAPSVDTSYFPISDFCPSVYTPRSLANQNPLSCTLINQNMFCTVPRSNSLFPVGGMCCSSQLRKAAE